MAAVAGIVKQISGVIIAVDANGKERILQVGDEIFVGETVRAQNSSSNALISLNGGKEVVVDGEEVIKMDLSVANQSSFGADAIADVSALQQAILQGENLEGLEETAAGGSLNSGNSGTAQINDGYFTAQGTESNVSANILNLGTVSVAGIANSNFVGNNSGVSGYQADAPDTTAPTAVSISFTEAGNDNILNSSENGISITTTTANIKPGLDAVPGDTLHYVITHSNGTQTQGSRVLTPADIANGVDVNINIIDGSTPSVSAYITDQAGNNGAVTNESLKVDLSAMAPTIEFTSVGADNILNISENNADGDRTTTKAKISIPADAVEGDTLFYSINGGAQQSVIIDANMLANGYIVSVPVSDGATPSVVASIQDQAGNQSPNAQNQISVDLTAPIIGLTPQADGAVDFRSAVNNTDAVKSVITYTRYDGTEVSVVYNRKADLSWEQDASNPANGLPNTIANNVQTKITDMSFEVKDGTNFTVTTTDKAGNESTKSVVVDDKLAITSVVVSNPNNVVIKLQINETDSDAISSTVTYTRANGTQVSVKFNKNSDGTWTQDASNAQNDLPATIATKTGQMILESKFAQIGSKVIVETLDDGGNIVPKEGIVKSTALTIEIPLSAYVNENPAEGLLPEFSSKLPVANSSFTMFDENGLTRTYLVYNNNGAGKFTQQDGWYISADKSLVIGSDNAGALNVNSSLNLSTNAGIFAGDKSDAITIDGVQVGNIYGGYDDTSALAEGSNQSGIGGDTINLVNSAIASNIKGGTGRDNISLEDGSKADRIAGGWGDNKILVADGSQVHNWVFGTDGERSNYDSQGINQITVTGTGTQVGWIGDVSSGAADVKVTDGATVNHYISTDKGDDHILIDNATVMESVFGNEDNDTITVQNGATVVGKIMGSDGNETILVQGANTKVGAIEGGHGNDRITLTDGAKTDATAAQIAADSVMGKIHGDDGNDEIIISNGAEVVNSVGGNAGDDTITLTAAKSHSLSGNAGDDTIVVEQGAQVVHAVHANTGNGGDTILVKDAGTIVNGITSDATSTITLTDGAKVNGNIMTGGDGVQNINVLNGAEVAHKIDTTRDAGTGNSTGVGNSNDYILVDNAKVSGSIITGAKEDTVTLKDATVGSISGAETVVSSHSNGTDLVVDSASNGTIDLSRLTSGNEQFNSVDVSSVNNAVLSVNPKDILDLGSQNNTLEIKGGGDDKVSLKASDGWQEDTANSDANYRAYKADVTDDNGAAQTVIIKVETDVQTDL